MLKRWLVALTAGLVKPRTLIWKGRSKTAPDNPPIEVKREMANANTGGTHGLISMPATGKYISSPFMD
jgi:hypothetical protein